MRRRFWFATALTAPLVYARPTTWDGFWSIALAEQFRGVGAPRGIWVGLRYAFGAQKGTD